MDAVGEIEIKLEGSIGKEKLRPEHVDAHKNNHCEEFESLRITTEKEFLAGEDLRDGAYA